MTTNSIRAAAALFWLNGIGFGFPAVLAIRNLMQHRDIPIIFGFPAYGGGFFERHGIKTTIPLLVAFLVVNILEVVAGGLLIAGLRSGAILGFALIPFGAVFWLGFDLPIPWVIALARSILVAVDWNRLR